MGSEMCIRDSLDGFLGALMEDDASGGGFDPLSDVPPQEDVFALGEFHNDTDFTSSSESTRSMSPTGFLFDAAAMDMSDDIGDLACSYLGENKKKGVSKDKGIRKRRATCREQPSDTNGILPRPCTGARSRRRREHPCAHVQCRRSTHSIDALLTMLVVPLYSLLSPQAAALPGSNVTATCHAHAVCTLSLIHI